MKKIVFGITLTTAFLIAGFFGGALSNVSGEAFLRTKGGSVITCAGSSVYIEKSNPEGYAYLTDIVRVKKDYKNVLSTIYHIENDARKEELHKLEKNLKNRSSDALMIFLKEQVEQAKLEKNLNKVAYWEKRLEKSSPDLTKKQLEEAKEKRNKYLEKIRKAKEGNEKKAKEGRKKILLVAKEIFKLEERLKNIKKEDTKETICNSQGQFNFSKLPPDTYYISTTVEWYVGDKKQGGAVAKTVILNEGENKIFINK